MIKGSKHTLEARVKLSIARAKQVIRLGEPCLGRHLTSETRAKMRFAAMHRSPISEETRIKMRLAHTGEKNRMWGKHHSKETRAKLRTAKLGKNAGPEHPCWKGGAWIDPSGYRVVYFTGRRKQNYAFEHRLLAEKALGRSLKGTEVVHHINGNKTDNRKSNLLICSASYHRWLENKMALLYKQEHFNQVAL